MSRDLNDLVVDFRQDVVRLITACEREGIIMRPYFTLRSPWAQARLWRQSRSIEEINRMAEMLREDGAAYLADVLISVGPQFGDPVTDALPGQSWHQWGEAVDCFWLVDGRAEWSDRREIEGKNGYRVYTEQAELHGLTAGGRWSRLKDWPHVQKSRFSSPLSAGHSWSEISSEMQTRFGNSE